MSLYERLPPDAPGSLVLGIDPGSRLTGFGVVRDTGRGCEYVASGCIRTGNGPLPERLQIVVAQHQARSDAAEADSDQLSAAVGEKRPGDLDDLGPPHPLGVHLRPAGSGEAGRVLVLEGPLDAPVGAGQHALGAGGADVDPQQQLHSDHPSVGLCNGWWDQESSASSTIGA